MTCRGVFLVVVLAMAGCKKKEEPAPRPTAATTPPTARAAAMVPGDAEGLWLYARVDRERAAPPARFAAPLPTTLAEWKRFADHDPSMPPRGHVEDLLCLLDEGMLGRLDAALDAAPAAERAELLAKWSDAIEYCGEGGAWGRFCPRARAILTEGKRAVADVVLLPFGRVCASKEDHALFERAGAPPAAVRAYANALSWSSDKAARALARKLCAKASTDREECKRMSEHDRDRPEEKAAPGGSREDAAKLADQLRTIGLLGPEKIPLPENTFRAHTAADLLEMGGRALAFDAETGTFPNHHDEPMRELAWLCRPALDGVFFSEIPPRDYETPEGYVLETWVAGERLSTPAENLGDWYDVDAVIGMVNESLRTVGSDCRLLVLPADGQVAVVAAGPAPALVEAVQAGLFEPSDADRARQLGKEFEDKVFDELGGEGERDVVIPMPE